MRGLALSTRGVDYHGEGTVVRSLSGLKLRQLVPAKGLDANQIITTTPRTGAEPIVLKSNIGANADVREQNNLKVYHHPNKTREARELMGMADIIRVRPSGSASELYGYTWDTPEYHPDWGNVPKYGKESQPARTFVAADFDLSEKIFGETAQGKGGFPRNSFTLVLTDSISTDILSRSAE